jgi:hypothetical protein
MTKALASEQSVVLIYLKEPEQSVSFIPDTVACLHQVSRGCVVSPGAGRTSPGLRIPLGN